MDFAKLVREIRTDLGLTQKGLADALFVSESAVQKWETGKNTPRMDEVMKMLALAGKKLAVISDNESNTDIADTSDADVPVKPAGKTTRYKAMGMPDWVEDRFGSDVPDWAEERWGSDDDDWDDEDVLAVPASSATNCVDPLIPAQVVEFLFDEIRKDEVYKGTVSNVQNAFGKTLVFVNVDGLIVACEVQAKIAGALRNGDMCFVRINNKDKECKRVFGSIIRNKPVFRAKINYVTTESGVAVVGLSKEDSAPSTNISLAVLAEADGLSYEECKAKLPGKVIDYEVLTYKDINNKRIAQTGENRNLYKRERHRYWYGGKVNAGDEVCAEIFDVRKQEVEIWLHGAKITVPASKCSEKYCSDLRDELLIGDTCKVKVNSIILSESPEADNYSVSVEAELREVIRIVDPHGELFAATYEIAKEKGYKVYVISPSKDECEPPR